MVMNETRPAFRSRFPIIFSLASAFLNCPMFNGEFMAVTDQARFKIKLVLIDLWFPAKLSPQHTYVITSHFKAIKSLGAFMFFSKLITTLAFTMLAAFLLPVVIKISIKNNSK